MSRDAIPSRTSLLLAATLAGTMALEIRAMERFFTASRFAVVGASADRSKFGNKVLRWYLDRQLPVTPVHPKLSQMEGCVADKDMGHMLEQAGTPSEAPTSVSVITPPVITLGLLQQYASNEQIKAFWLQPGAADGAVGA